jgi:rhodanese-related sulfurtransferase
MSSYNEIVKNLYVGSASALINKGIFALIVNCTKSLIGSPGSIRIPIDDDESECDNLIKHLRETNVLERINDALSKKQTVLVHCYAGIQRSCAVVACYLIRYHQMTPVSAIAFIRSKRIMAFDDAPTFLAAINTFYETL